MVHSKIEGKVHRFPTHSLPPCMCSVSCCQHPHQRGTFITVDELTWIHHNHSKCTFYIGFTFGAVHSLGLDLLHFSISKFVLCILEFPFDSFYIFLLRFAICMSIMITFSFLAPEYTVDLGTAWVWTTKVRLHVYYQCIFSYDFLNIFLCFTISENTI